MKTNKGFSWWIPIVAVIFICILCGGILGLSGFILSIIKRNNPQIGIPFLGTYIPTMQAEMGTTPFPQSTASAPTESVTSTQLFYNYYFFDEFTSPASGWQVYNDDNTILKYEDGKYHLEVTKPDSLYWSYAPINFYGSEINFQVKGLPGPQNGTVGMFCQFHDIDNYYYVEFDLEMQDYLVGVISNGSETLLTVNPGNNDWEYSQGLLPYPEQLNDIHITCTQDYISLSINDQWNGDYQVPVPFDSTGEIAFFVYSFDFPDSEGYHVMIDDVEIFNPNP